MPGATDGWSRSRNTRDESTRHTTDGSDVAYDETPAYYISVRDQWTEHLSKAYERWTILGDNFEIRFAFPRKFIRKLQY